MVRSDQYQVAERRRSLGRRVAEWSRWPWNPSGVHFSGDETQPYRAVVWVRGNLLGDTPIDQPESTTVVRLSRWVALSGIFSPIEVEVEIKKNHRFKEAAALEKARR